MRLCSNARPLFLQAGLTMRALFDAKGARDELQVVEGWAMSLRIVSFLSSSQQQHTCTDVFTVLYRLHESDLHKNLVGRIKAKQLFINTCTPVETRKSGIQSILWTFRNIMAWRGLPNEYLTYFLKRTRNELQIRIASSRCKRFISLFMRRRP